ERAAPMCIVTEALHEAPFAVHAIQAAVEGSDPQSAATVLEHLRDEIAGQGGGAARGMAGRLVPEVRKGMLFRVPTVQSVIGADPQCPGPIQREGLNAIAPE